MTGDTQQPEWYYISGDQRIGPVGFTAITDLIVTRQISAETLLWRNGFDDWTATESIEGFVPFLPTNKSPLRMQSPMQSEPLVDSAPKITVQDLLGSESEANANPSDQWKKPAGSAAAFYGGYSTEFKWALWLVGITGVVCLILSFFDTNDLNARFDVDLEVSPPVAGWLLIAFLNALPLFIFNITRYFKNGVGWGLACIFIPFAALIYIFSNWDLMWRVVLLNIACSINLYAAMYYIDPALLGAFVGL